jgi:hypothetical protein
MKFAYADPPYHGCGKLYDHLHDEARKWDDKQTHLDLVQELLDTYADGWALSCNPRDLQWILPNCPDNIRVCAWVKTYHQVRPLVSVQYAWEPVILYGGRKIKNRKPWVRDWTTGAVTKQTGTPGAKPHYFNAWILLLLGYQDGDTLHDVFPGSGGMERQLQQGVMF